MNLYCRATMSVHRRRKAYRYPTQKQIYLKLIFMLYVVHVDALYSIQRFTHDAHKFSSWIIYTKNNVSTFLCLSKMTQEIVASSDWWFEDCSNGLAVSNYCSNQTLLHKLQWIPQVIKPSTPTMSAHVAFQVMIESQISLVEFKKQISCQITC